jgi:ABC-type nitrate/sulfonate/bicarbonate transport system ATPase subunit
MTTIKLDKVTQSYGDNLVIGELSLELIGPSITVLMGPSGCGKSTILRMMGGVRPQKTVTPSSGQVLLDNVPCLGESDDAVTVFQQYSNRPDLTVRQNVEFPFTLSLWKKKLAKPDLKVAVDRMVEAVGLADKQNLYPRELSGGQNQRVALARALVLQPKILLMDEPFGALDHYTREEMQKLLIDLYNAQPCSIVLVTHDVREAITIADRVIMMAAKPGRIILDQKIGYFANGKAILNPPNPALESELVKMLAPK